MTPRRFLVSMTAIAVVSDSVLHPFYPQYFARVLGVTDPMHIGMYIAACSLTVLLAFPVWALLSRSVGVLRLLVATQVVTCLLSLVCATVTSVPWFWFVSLTMLVFKASYLLIYPYVMTFEKKDQQVGAISLLAFVVYFGNIVAALLAGVVLEWMDPRFLFLVMACGDLAQIAICLCVPRSAAFTVEPPAAPAAHGVTAPRFFAVNLCVVMLIMYFSAYLTEPFFSKYWESLVAAEGTAVTGLVFAVPGVAALAGLYANTRWIRDTHPLVGVVPSVLLCTAGLWAQASSLPVLVLLGRLLYGWGLFQAMVRLDALLFQFSTPESYAVDFSKANLFQGFGVLVASLVAGTVVARLGPGATFALASGGFIVGLTLYVALIRPVRASLEVVDADLYQPKGSS